MKMRDPMLAQAQHTKIAQAQNRKIAQAQHRKMRDPVLAQECYEMGDPMLAQAGRVM